MAENILSDYIRFPFRFHEILNDSQKMDFKLASNPDVGALLRTLVSSKPKSKILELGTGTGLGAIWIIDGMDNSSEFHTVENDKKLLSILQKYFSEDSRVKIYNSTGEDFISKNINVKYDFIFADTWPGKFILLDEVLDMIKIGGIYLIDDMKIMNDWPKEHIEKVSILREKLNKRTDFNVCNLEYSTGLMICSKLF